MCVCALDKLFSELWLFLVTEKKDDMQEMSPASFKPNMLQLHGQDLKPLGDQDAPPPKLCIFSNYYFKEKA